MRRAPLAVRGASATDEGNALTAGGVSAESSGAGSAARGGIHLGRALPHLPDADGAASPGRAHAGAVSSSSSKMISRAATRPITLRNMARQRSAAKPDQRPMQNRAAGGQLHLHRWGATETHPDGNHRYPRRKPEAARSADEPRGQGRPGGQGREPEHAQRVEEARAEGRIAFQPVDQPEQHGRRTAGQSTGRWLPRASVRRREGCSPAQVMSRALTNVSSDDDEARDDREGDPAEWAMVGAGFQHRRKRDQRQGDASATRPVSARVNRPGAPADASAAESGAMITTCSACEQNEEGLPEQAGLEPKRSGPRGQRRRKQPRQKSGPEPHTGLSSKRTRLAAFCGT